MNKRHALFKACKKAWWDFLRSTIIVAALVYTWFINLVPWLFVALSISVLIALCVIQVAENYAEIQRNHQQI